VNPRNRKPAPQLAPESLYVRAPLQRDQWPGRRLVMLRGVKVGGGEFTPQTVWTIERRSSAPGGWVLAGELCPHCGVQPRFVESERRLRDRAVAGWLPL